MSNPWEMTVADAGGSIDEHELRRFFGLVLEDGDHHIVTGNPHWKARLISGADIDGAIAQVGRVAEGAIAVYWTINPYPASYGDRQGNAKECLCRKFFFVDIDAPSTVQATHEERGEVFRIAIDLVEYLQSLGWPNPIMIDSGNGCQLLWRVDLPPNRHVQQVFRGALRTLGRRFGVSDKSAGRAGLDTAVHSAKQLAKVPGTWSRKGSPSPDRPPRMARILWAPDRLITLDFDLIRALSGEDGHAEAPKSRDPWEMTVGAPSAGGPKAYLARAVEGEIARLALAVEGSRNNALNRAAFTLGQFADWPECDQSSIKSALRTAALRTGLSESEVDRTIERSWEDGRSSPRARPEPEAAAETPNDAETIDIPLFKWASSITPRKVEFLWPGRIPLGKLTTFAGQGGLGKTFVLCDIAARVTRGAEWPYSGGDCAPEGKVLFVSGEDDEDDTLVPRLIECGADLGRIGFLSEEASDIFSLVNLDMMGRILSEMGQGVNLVIIDPPTSYLDTVDDHRNSELRSKVLRPLKGFAQKHRCAIILNTHVNKMTGANVDAASRVMGSVAWTNGVRSASMFVRDPEDASGERVLFIPYKTNVSKRACGLAFRIKETDTLAVVEWEGTTDQSADDALSAKITRPRDKDAARTIIEVFRERQEWPSDDFFRALRERGGITYHMVNKLREDLSIPRPRPDTGADGRKTWIWSVPPDWVHLREAGSDQPF